MPGSTPDVIAPPRRQRWPLYREAVNAALLGLVVNLVLGVVKLAAGLSTGVFALVADAVNSLGDVVTTLVVLYAFYIAQKPPDAEHPYGHSRAEAVAGSNVAVLLFVSALGIGWEAIQQMHHEHGSPPLWTLGIAVANAVIKEGLYRYKLAVGRRTGSSALVANAWDHRSDALCALAVFFGLAAVRWGGPAMQSADEIAALVVTGAILWSSVGLFRSSAFELMDVQAEDEFVAQIRQAAAQTPGVAAVEKLLVRKSGLEYFVDIHVQVPAEMSVSDGHRIGHEVKDALLNQFLSVRDVLVHLEPHPHDHE